MTLSIEELLRRFLLHWLPRGFVRIGSSDSLRIAVARRSCRSAGDSERKSAFRTGSPVRGETSADMVVSHCGGPMATIARLTARDLIEELAMQNCVAKSSWRVPTFGEFGMPFHMPVRCVFRNEIRPPADDKYLFEVDKDAAYHPAF